MIWAVWGAGTSGQGQAGTGCTLPRMSWQLASKWGGAWGEHGLTGGLCCYFPRPDQHWSDDIPSEADTELHRPVVGAELELRVSDGEEEPPLASAGHPERGLCAAPSHGLPIQPDRVVPLANPASCFFRSLPSLQPHPVPRGAHGPVLSSPQPRGTGKCSTHCLRCLRGCWKQEWLGLRPHLAHCVLVPTHAETAGFVESLV